MKTYTYKELCTFVEQQLEANLSVFYYLHKRSQSKICHPFIKLEEPICFTPYWRGRPQTFQKGDYLHADLEDIYGITAEMFNRYYVLAET